MDLEVGFWASRLRFGPQTGIWASRMRFWPQEWDLGLKDRIWTLRLGFRPQDWDFSLIVGFGWGGRRRRRRRRRKFPMCESISHPPLRGRCPAPFKHNLLRQGTGTAEHLTLLRLLYIWGIFSFSFFSFSIPPLEAHILV